MNYQNFGKKFNSFAYPPCRSNIGCIDNCNYERFEHDRTTGNSTKRGHGLNWIWNRTKNDASEAFRAAVKFPFSAFTRHSDFGTTIAKTESPRWALGSTKRNSRVLRVIPANASYERIRLSSPRLLRFTRTFNIQLLFVRSRTRPPTPGHHALYTHTHTCTRFQ